jgi:NitT/TauT family transport system substrate-binding protein
MSVWLRGCALVLVLLVLAACAPAQVTLTPAIVSVASPAVSVLPLYVGVQEGLFRARGVELSLQQMAGNVGQTGLLKGEIQFLSSPTDAMTGATNGLPFKIVFSAWERAPWTVVGKPEVANMAGIRGKIVGTNRPGTAPYSYLEAGLKRAGLSISDVSILYLNGTQDNFAALLAGQIDAAVLSPPFDLQAEAQGFHEIAFLGDTLQVPYTGLATSTDYMQAHRDVVVNVIRGMLDAEDWIRAHPDGSAAHIQAYLGVSPDIAQQAYARAVGSLTTTGETQPEGIKQQLAIVSAALNREVQLDPGDAVDFGPLREARTGR